MKNRNTKGADLRTAWDLAKKQDPSLPRNPPRNLTEDAQKAICALATRFLDIYLETEWTHK